MHSELSRLITAPTYEPVTLAQAKAHLRIETTADDATVTQLIAAARMYTEKVAWRGLCQQTWERVLGAFPCEDTTRLPKGHLATLPDAGDPPVPVSPVTYVKYLDANGVRQTLATSVYEVNTGDANTPGSVVLKYNQQWPSTRDRWDAVVIRYVVGWAEGAVPPPVMQAELLLISQMYEQRTPEITGTIVAQVRFAFDALIAPYRFRRFS